MLRATKKIDVVVVLALEAPGIIEELADPCWVAMQEAAGLFRPNDEEWLTVPLDADHTVAVLPHIEHRRAGAFMLDDAPPVVDASKLRVLLAEASADTSSTTSALIDQRALVGFMRDALGTDAGTVVVITDRSIQPPTGFRYLIWDAVPGGVGISIAPLDPAYWGERASVETRRADVRRRVRATLCSVLGTTIGLLRCENPTCFLFADVDRVARLDHFVRIGEEHGVEGLTGRGFVDNEDPAAPGAVADVAEPML